MSTILPERLMTAEQFLALPDDGVERWLIDGNLREGGMPVRNRFHSSAMAFLTHALVEWWKRQPEPRGMVYCGDVGVRLSHHPDSLVGADVAYVPPDVLVTQTDLSTIIDGIPILAVEILSPSDRLDEIQEKRDSYLRAGVQMVWHVDPRDRTVLIYRRGGPSRFLQAHETIIADPELPGLQIPLANIFVE